MEIKQLQSFQSVVEYGGYQKAADALGYTQSTITIHIQQLEQELGIQLFQRVGRKMVLTTIGRQILQHTQDLLNSAKKITNTALEGQSLTGTLRVDVADTILCYNLQNVLKRFREAAPKVKIVLQDLDPKNIAENIFKGTCDLGVSYRMDWHEDMVDVEILPAQCEPILVVAPSLKNLDLITPNQHKNTSFIIDEPESPYRRQVEQYLRTSAITLDETIELWSTEAIKSCVMSGMGFSYLPKSAVKHELEQGTLVKIETPLSGKLFHPLCGQHKNSWESPAMKLFKQILREEFYDGLIY